MAHGSRGAQPTRRHDAGSWCGGDGGLVVTVGTVVTVVMVVMVVDFVLKRSSIFGKNVKKFQTQVFEV